MNIWIQRIAAGLRRFEGCVLKAYRDIVGVWTIGYGETKGVKPGMVWTQEQANADILTQSSAYMRAVLRKCPALAESKHEWMLVACVWLAYNIGIGAFSASSVCRLTKRGEYRRAADCFLLWDKAGGRVVKALLWRRRQERATYLKALG